MMRRSAPTRRSPSGRRDLSRAVAAVAVLAASAVATPPANAFPLPGGANIAPQCVARVNKAALQAMDRTSPLGQMQIFGSPAVFNPHLLRVTVSVFGARTEIYRVDVTIDDACRVLSASTDREYDGGWPYW
jgi:hypothetical protein